jgi:hypothetical protein
MRHGIRLNRVRYGTRETFKVTPSLNDAKGRRKLFATPNFFHRISLSG